MIPELEFNRKILSIVEEFNTLMKEAVTGPNCIDPNICHADCCFIHIDVPRVLAQFYIRNGWATPEYFIGGDVFSLKIDVDMEKLRCIFYDPVLNGCSLHKTGMKPPQCWVYPTGLDPYSVKHECKKAGGWDVLDANKLRKAASLMTEYVDLCKREYNEFISEENILYLLKQSEKDLKISLGKISPYSIAGIKFKWDRFELETHDGYALAAKSICTEIARGRVDEESILSRIFNTADEMGMEFSEFSCKYSFFECPHSCENFSEVFLLLFKKTLPKIVRSVGLSEIIEIRQLLEFL